MARRVILVALALGALPSARAGAFLAGEAARAAAFEERLLAPATLALGAQAVERRLAKLQSALVPMYTSLPKNEHGRLTHAVARYALHRLFMQWHGWFIRGLDSGREAEQLRAAGRPEPTNTSARSDTGELQLLLEHQVGDHGLALRDLAVLGVAVGELVRQEEEGRLLKAYGMMGESAGAAISEDAAREVLEAVMLIYVIGDKFSAVDRAQVQWKKDIMKARSPDWMPILGMITESLRENLPETEGSRTFAEMRRLVEDLGGRYVPFNDRECHGLKTQLLTLEGRKPGRVPLDQYYRQALYGEWQFDEKVEYLRAVGSLDESEPQRPQVIVANYVGAFPNCLLASGLYAVCCRNECEDLLGSIERHVAAPEAQPEELLKVVASLGSDTVAAPRALSKHLESRLRQVAREHGGTVPLHGRLFGQWLHHAFPRECPFPHEAGTILPQTADEWMASTGLESARASKEEMEQVCSAVAPSEAERLQATSGQVEAEELPWSMNEEILPHRQGPGRGAGSHSLLWLLPAVLASVAVALWRTGALSGPSSRKLARW